MSALSRVICKVPGSTSNCGSGFDTLGLALSLYNEICVERADAEADEAFGPDIFPRSEMAQRTVARFFEKSGIESFAVRIRIRGDVPQARGLGSSVTVRAGILAGVATLADSDWDREDYVELITELEGHPDNASASILGGFTVSRFVTDPAKVESVAQFDIGEELRFVVIAPEFEVLTSASRGVLPKQLPFADAIASINSAACVVAALSSGQYEALEGSVHDLVHEPYRLKNIPGAADAIRSGIEAGAYTGWLSGSGSSVLCACRKGAVDSVTEAMQGVFKKAGLKSVAYDLSADNAGLQVTLSE
ncbi:homoserine kinase [Pelagicoccus sp. SDUM812003]|uniref:homoserine kinase n=1 Tax=Pelagicoccus sp. SDUM812003 TaxID=3041267 RepID=UPI00280E05F1|nr:homoserine kinase [Pelagicoccus sp. SDUM812003]MDQ8205430.1 homoserine kinase [Pelagicoccus sp. SDUM812003]